MSPLILLVEAPERQQAQVLWQIYGMIFSQCSQGVNLFGSDIIFPQLLWFSGSSLLTSLAGVRTRDISSRGVVPLSFSGVDVALILSALQICIFKPFSGFKLTPH